jgi:putative molybdopterin biosynthesis protein
MDPGLKEVGGILKKHKTTVSLLPVPLSSLDGLIALRQGLCQMSTTHLIDRETGEYNRPFIRRLFPGQPMALIQIYQRIEGFLVKPGNPLGIRTIADLARPDVRLVNREQGSGVRQWLDLQLARLGIPPEMVRGYTEIAHSHDGVARAIRAGMGNAGISIAASARIYDLEFVPLFEEPYEIVTPFEILADKRYAAFFDVLNSTEFRTAILETVGYEFPQSSVKFEVVR